jgi:hypothetical protein
VRTILEVFPLHGNSFISAVLQTVPKTKVPFKSLLNPKKEREIRISGVRNENTREPAIGAHFNAILEASTRENAPLQTWGKSCSADAAFSRLLS